MGATPAVSFGRVSFRYEGGAREVIHNIDLDVQEGEFLLIAGASGSGKTTLSRCINGLVPHFFKGELAGEVHVAGKDTRAVAVSDIGTAVGSVFQDPRSQFFMTDTTSEVAFGCANAGLSQDEIQSRVDSAFERVGIERLRDKSVFELSSGEMQQVAVASCYALGSDVYVFDEPSANLDMNAVDRLGLIMRELKNEGKTIVVLEHRLFYLRDLFDRMAVAEGGAISRLYSNREASALTESELSHMGLRSFHLETFRTQALRPRSSDEGATLSFEASDLEFSYGRRGRGRRRPHDDADGRAFGGPVSFHAQVGEVVGIVGRNGAGKTTFARACCGLARQHGGTLSLDGCALACKERLGTVRLIMQDSDYQLFSDSVLGELALGTEQAPSASEQVLQRLGLWSRRDDHPATLSRGMKQRLTIASALVDDSRVFFFDEPTSGLDKRAMQEVASLLRSLATDDRLVFVISHDYEFLLAACTRVLHLEAGRLTDDFSLTDAARERLAAALWEEGAPWKR